MQISDLDGPAFVFRARLQYIQKKKIKKNRLDLCGESIHGYFIFPSPSKRVNTTIVVNRSGEKRKKRKEKKKNDVKTQYQCSWSR